MTPLLHLGGQTRLDATVVLALAAALVVVGFPAIWLARRYGGVELALLLIVVWFVCLGGVWQAGAWSSVTLDTAARTVAGRIGFLGVGTPPLTWGFDEYRAVVVSLERSSENEAVTTVGSGFNKTSTRIRTTYAFDVSLRGGPRAADRSLPLRGDGKTPDEAEALAAEVARLGGWPMLRRGYVRDAVSGEPTWRGVEFDAESPLAAPAGPAGSAAPAR